MNRMMNNHDLKIGFLFDLDGVIINSEEEYSRIWSQINKEFPSGVPNLEQVIKGGTLSKILNDYYPDLNVQKQVARRLHELENQMKYDYLPYAEEFLLELKKRGLPTALVTSSDNEKMAHLREELPGVFNLFDYIVTGDQVSSSKPDPEGYLLAASKLDLAPERCVVFEDSLQGVMSGKNAGAYVVGIIGTLPAEKLLPFSNNLINNFSELNLDELIQILNEQ